MPQKKMTTETKAAAPLRTIANRHTPSALDRVFRGNTCAGCGACAGLFPSKIAMHVQAPGYLRPDQSVTLDPEENRLIAAICPGLRQDVVVNDGAKDSTLWGPYFDMRIGWAVDPELRHAASSGGALSGMLNHLLAEGRVDAVVQTAADPDLAIGNATVISADSLSIKSATGSRYAPSAPLEKLRELQADGRRFAFVGKPCDTAALRALIIQEPDFGRVFPVLLSFFCAGVPSHSGARAVLDAIGVAESQTSNFRFRGNGWPGRATATLNDGSTRDMSYNDSWGQILSKHVQHRCKICADGTGTAADIVCADAWESDENGYPLFEEQDGISLIVARSRLGVELLAQAEQSGAIQTANFDPARLASIQPGQRERRRALLARLAGLRLMGRPIPTYQGLHLWAAARQNKPARNLKNFLGMVRRVLQNRI